MIKLFYLVALLLLVDNFQVGSALDPLPDIINSLRQEHKDVQLGVTIESRCTYEVLSSFVSRCDDLDGFVDWERSRVAIQLSLCIFNDDNYNGMHLPASCKEDILQRKEVEICVSELSENPVWWTTYFGYLNLIDSVCHYYDNSLETQKLLENYRTVLDRFELLFETLNEFKGVEFLKKTRESLNAQFVEFFDQLMISTDVRFGAAVQSMTDILENSEQIMGALSNRMEEFENQMGDKFKTMMKDFDSSQKNLSIKAASTMNGLMEEIKGSALEENEALLKKLVENEKQLFDEVVSRQDSFRSRYEEQLQEYDNHMLGLSKQLKTRSKEMESLWFSMTRYRNYVSYSMRVMALAFFAIVGIGMSRLIGGLGFKFLVEVTFVVAGVCCGSAGAKWLSDFTALT
ncbi:DEKNAAC102697 [Brettanomyces naardenensis]|uniref:Nuclear fusion protein KAR5 n=1 Tax=Brettanomyces naardenensis TaxID=13370 RepID=A0A448YL65_BRENA|nr:DEKNAAC102697 [Brettanomyces naardenensis]